MTDIASPAPSPIAQPAEPPRPPKPWDELSAAERTDYRRARAEWRRTNHGETFVAMSKWVAQVRRQAGLTREGFAKRLQVSRATVSRWERGDTFPALEHRVRLQQLERETED